MSRLCKHSFDTEYIPFVFHHFIWYNSLMEIYLSVREPSESRLEIKKSVFITRLIPVSSETEAEDILAAIRKEHYRATHHCYAWIIGRSSHAKKFSDDGEPQGTAGRPMLSALEHSSLTNVMAVVIRYFGGIKLGASGLTRAYSQAVTEAVAAAPIKREIRAVPITVGTDYSAYARLESYALGRGWNIQQRDFSAEVTFTVNVPLEEADAAESAFTELSMGKAVLSRGEETIKEINGE